MLLFEAFKRCVSFRRRFRSAAHVTIAELEEAEVALLMVDVVRDGLQAAEEERLAHHVQVGTQRVHERYASVSRHRCEALVIGAARERIVHDLVEARAAELLGDERL